MKFKVLHNMRGRMRIHVMTNEMTDLQADKLEYDLAAQDMILTAKVYERTGDVVITYMGERQVLLSYLQTYCYKQMVEADETLARSGRAMNRKYWDKLVNRVVLRMGSKLFVPAPIRTGLVLVKSLSYIKKALSCVGRRKIEVPLLDGIAITTSIVRGDYGTAGSVMFLLDLGEIMEEWTHKKSVDDLAKKMSLNVSKVWLSVDGKEVLTDVSKIETGDCVTVHMGNVIPLDGVVKEGEGMVNQASLTGEAIPVAKKPGGYVYAGTVLEEGELLIEVKENSGTTKYEKIVAMIEETEKLKSGRASGRPFGSVYIGRNRSCLSFDEKCYQSTFCTDGRFFLCTEIIYADFCFVSNARSSVTWHYRQRWKVLRGNSRGRYNCF